MINDPDAIGSDKFAMILRYSDKAKIATAFTFKAQYNGNISWLVYRMVGVNSSFRSTYFGQVSTNYVGRVFSYDSTSRLTAAPFGFYYSGYWFDTNNYYGEAYSYSDDGNFSTLTRRDSSGGLSDNLTYQYTSGTNRLDSVANAAGTCSKYTYDANGNVVSDTRSGIAFIIYDISNLPVAMYTTAGVSQIYAYDVNGSRVRKYASNGTDTYYLNDATGRTEVVQKGTSNSVYTYNIYGSDNIGQILRNGATVRRYYYLKDHLGTVRMLVDTSGAVDSYTDVYPYGMQMPGRNSTASADTRYKYTGKERDTETGWDYFGARYYDARTGRFLGIDPHGARYPGMSPYCYAGSNPVAFVDPTGMDSTFYVIVTSQTTMSPAQVTEVAAQVQSVLDQNDIPMQVQIAPNEAGFISGVVGSDPDGNGVPQTLTVTYRPLELTETDVSVSLVTDAHKAIQNAKAKDKDAEGIMPENSRAGAVTEGAMKRKGLSELGLGNLVAHEGFHGMGLRTHKSGTIMQAKQSNEDANRRKQSLDSEQKRKVLKEFLGH